VVDVHQRCRHGVLIIAKLSKEGCISLVARRRPFRVAHKHDLKKVWAPLNLKNILFKNRSIENMKPGAQIRSH
jgi:hypothetical protein